MNSRRNLDRVAIVNDGIKDISVTQAQPFQSDNVNIKLADRKLIVSNGVWEMSASVHAFPFASLNKGKMLLDIELKPLVNVEADTVAPHGILGQSYDGDQFDFDGARDTAQAGEMTTKAQGEGAIEGTIADYKMTSRFDTQFIYSRFDKLTAKPRDTNKLTGKKRVKVAGGSTVQAASAPADMVEA